MRIKQAATVAGIALAIVVAPNVCSPAQASAHDPYDQRSFPCQEDELLGYAPQFGPDRVGCIHIDVLTGDNVVTR